MVGFLLFLLGLALILGTAHFTAGVILCAFPIGVTVLIRALGI